MVSRFEIYLVNLDAVPTRDARNTRPCVVISPDEMNRNIRSVIIAPLTSGSALYPTRVPTNFLNGERMIALDQIRAIDGVRLVKKIGSVDTTTQTELLKRLAELFAE